MKTEEEEIDLTAIPRDLWLEKYMGKGYRSACYVSPGKGLPGCIKFFGFDKAGRRTTFVCPHKCRVKYRVGYDTGEKDIFGNYVQTKYFESPFDRKRWIEDNQSVFIVQSMKPEQEFLFDLFKDVVLDSDFNQQPLRVFYIDIETEMGDQFEGPATAAQRINMITVYDTGTEKFHTWSLYDEPKNKFAPEIADSYALHTFRNNEALMLQWFIDWWHDNIPDVVCGWNSEAFDIPYVIRRIENVFGEEDLGKKLCQRLSPVGRYSKKLNERDINENKRANVAAEITVNISGIFLADALRLYRDKFQIRPALDGGYGLTNVGDAEGLGKKLDYSEEGKGTLRDLYMKNRQMFYEYNVRDVELLKNIEQKTKLIALARRVTSIGLSDYGTVYGSASYLIQSLTIFAATKMPTPAVFQTYLKEDYDRTPYEGAFVFQPVPGLFTGGVIDTDYNSLYPSSIRSLNLSPETFVGKIESVEEV